LGHRRDYGGVRVARTLLSAVDAKVARKPLRQRLAPKAESPEPKPKPRAQSYSRVFAVSSFIYPGASVPFFFAISSSVG